MYRKIIVGYDDSDQAKDALALGKQLAEASGAELMVAGVFQFDPMWGGFDVHFQDADAEHRRQIEAAAESAGAKPKAFPSSSPARGLHELAEELEADLVLVGSASHGQVGQILAGSTGVALLHGSPCAVGIAPRGYREHADDPITTVVVGYDGSPESGHALTAGCELARETGAKLQLVSVAEPPAIGVGKGGSAGWRELKEAIEEIMRERLAEAEGRVPEGIDTETTFVSEDPAEALFDAATPGALLIVGSRAYGPLRRVLLGSVSTTLVRSVRSPLIVTPRGIHETAEAKRKARASVAM